MTTKAPKDLLNQRRIPKQARAKAKYKAILDACSRILGTHGYAKITITEISLESGLPYATIYQYFEKKDDIMVAWMARLFDQIGLQIAQQKQMADHQDMSQHVNTLIKTALMIIASNQVSMRELMSGMPQVLTSKMLMVVETRTVKTVNEIFSDTIQDINYPDLNYHLHILTRMLMGYLLQSILSEHAEIDIERDSAEIAFLVNAYLSKRGIISGASL